MNGDGTVDTSDIHYWVTDLKSTWIGDANLDGQVDASDLNALALNWRSTTATGWAMGDFNGDEKTDAADLDAIALNWRQSVPAMASATVPEPSGFLLAVLGVALVWRRPRRT